MTTKDLKIEMLTEAVKQLPIPKDFHIPSGFPVPLKDFIFAIKLTGEAGEEMAKTESGILLPAGNTPSSVNQSNTIIPHTAIVYAVGPEVEDYILPGMTVMYNPFANVEIMIKGVFYLRLRQSTDVYSIIPHGSFVYEGVKSEEYVRRSKRIGEFNAYHERKDKFDENEKDKKSEFEKKLLKSKIKKN